MTKKVTTIPALLNKQSTNQVGIVKKRIVAYNNEFISSRRK